MAASLQPIVLEVSTIADLLAFILDGHRGASTIVVCASKADFITWIKQDAVAYNQALENEQHRPLHDRYAPTLRLLSQSQTVTLAFCPEVAHLRAYLSVYAATLAARQPVSPMKPAAAAEGSAPMLAILNPLRLHQHTSNFTAQTLTRFIATAADAAYLSKSKLVLAEVPINGDERGEADEEHRAMTPKSSDNNNIEPPLDTDRDLWQAQVPIMNVSTKTFGAGERGWAGRTVQVKTIAQRWCVFEQYPGSASSS